MRGVTLVFGLIALVPCVARADDVAEIHVARARFTTDATNEVVNRVACQLDAHTDIAGQSRAIDIRVTSFGHPHQCATNLGASAFPMTVQAYGKEIVVEADMSGVAAENVPEVEEVVRGIAEEIKKRAVEADAAVVIKKTEAYSPALTVTGIIVGVVGFGLLLTGYLGIFVDAAQGLVGASPSIVPPLLMIGGGVALGLGAAFAIVGEHRVPVRTASIAPYFAPRVGGGTAGITFTF